jgi:hypothetical protein
MELPDPALPKRKTGPVETTFIGTFRRFCDPLLALLSRERRKGLKSSKIGLENASF